jgi:sterol desaturase/sphingolipid hydroxylase (fatty acid hydroxylase superfamily)
MDSQTVELEVGGKDYAGIRKRFRHYPQIDCPTFDEFLQKNPMFLVWPALLTLAMHLTVQNSEWVQNYMAVNEMQVFGFWPAVQLTIYSIMAVFATHGFIVAYQAQLQPHKVQKDLPYEFAADVTATRSVACLLFHMTYMALPIRPMSKTWVEFVIGYVCICMLNDAWFGAVHYVCHQFPAVYKFGHKTHHMNKTPNVFSAYFMESLQSMFQEHIPSIVVVFFCPVPLDVFLFYYYYGVLGSFLEHCGYEVDDMEIPLTRGKVKLGHVLQALGPLSLILGGQTTSMHDWHHEQFYGNYWLSYAYLDKLFGTYKGGTREERLADSPLVAKLNGSANAKDQKPKLDPKLGKGYSTDIEKAEPACGYTEATHCEGD